MKNNGYLSAESMTAVKGFAAVAVVLHHLYLTSHIWNGQLIRAIPQAFGYLAVALFFFTSGFGLMERYKQNGTAYLRSFPQKRILPYYGQMVLMILFYVLLGWLLGKPFRGRSILLAFVYNSGVIAYGWFLYVLLGAYLVFWLAARFCKGKTGFWAVMLGAFVAYGLLCGLVYHSALRCENLPAFGMGLLWSQNREKVEEKLEAHYGLILCSLAVLFPLSFCGQFLRSFSAAFALSSKIVSALTFTALVFVILKKCSLVCPATLWLGGISKEIYFIHGGALWIADRFLGTENPLRYIVTAFLLTVVLAMALRPILSAWVGLLKKLCP